MAVTYDSFLARFPQFSPRGSVQEQAAIQAMINAELGYARKQINAEIWGDHADDGVGLLAAHRIAKNPGGSGFARLVNKDGSTPYLSEYERLRDQLLVGDRVP